MDQSGIQSQAVGAGDSVGGGQVLKSSTRPAETDEMLRERLEVQHEESMQAVGHHRVELERHERLVRAARAGLAELNRAAPVEGGVFWEGDTPDQAARTEDPRRF